MRYLNYLFIVYTLSLASSPALAGRSCDYQGMTIPEPSFGGCPTEGFSKYVKTWNELIRKGVLTQTWEQYENYSEIFEKQYKQRLSLHFQGPANVKIKIKGRRFYEQPWKVDGGKILFDRLVNGDVTVANFLHMGWKVVTTENISRLIPPSTFKQFMEGFYSAYSLYLEEGGGQIHPAVPFKNLKDESVQFVRLGLDPAPNSNEWRLAYQYDEDPVDASFDSFAAAVSSARFPLNAFMFDHDIAHIGGYLLNRGVLDGSVEVFQRYLGLKNPYVGPSFFKEDGFRNYALNLRVGLVHEELALPRLEKSAEIQKLLPHLFRDSKYQTVQSHIQTSSKERQPILVARAALLTSSIDSLLIREGGGMLDCYNLFLELHVRSNAKKRVLLALNSMENFSPYFGLDGREAFSQIAVESLYGIADDLNFLSQLNALEEGSLIAWIKSNWGSHDMAFKVSRVHQLFWDRLARLEIALWAGIENEIEPSGFMRDATRQSVDPSSKLYRYIAAYAIPGSLTYKAVVSSELLETK